MVVVFIVKRLTTYLTFEMKIIYYFTSLESISVQAIDSNRVL